MGKASPVGRANGRANGRVEIHLSSQVIHMVGFVGQRSSLLYMVGRKGQGALRMIEVEEWDSNMVEQAEQKGQGLGLWRMVVRTIQDSGPRHMVGHVRQEDGHVGLKFVIETVGKWSEVGCMNERAVKGLKPRHMIDQAT